MTSSKVEGDLLEQFDPGNLKNIKNFKILQNSQNRIQPQNSQKTQKLENSHNLGKSQIYCEDYPIKRKGRKEVKYNIESSQLIRMINSVLPIRKNPLVK